MVGVVMTVSTVVGDGIVTSCAVSSTGDQMVNGGTFVLPAYAPIRASLAVDSLRVQGPSD